MTETVKDADGACCLQKKTRYFSEEYFCSDFCSLVRFKLRVQYMNT